MDNEAYKSGKKSFAHIQVSGFFLSFSFRAYQELEGEQKKSAQRF